MKSNAFSSGKNYGEIRPIIKPKTNIISSVDKDPVESLDKLPNGEYTGLRYAYIFELPDGTKYRTKYGVRNTKKSAQSAIYLVKNGNIYERTYSGLAEISSGMQGKSYGSSASLDKNISRITLDIDGFNIPKKVETKFKLNRKVKSFSTNNGIFRGGIKDPQISISNDNSIIRNKKDNESISQVKSNPVMVKYNKSAFNLSIEPWIVSPLMSDTSNGIYAGKLLGDTITSGLYKLMLSIKLNKQLPEDVVAFVQDSKAYIFKISQLTSLTGTQNSLFSKFFGECPDDGCVQPDPETKGKWMIISNKTGEPWKSRYDSSEKANNALKAYHANKHYSEIASDSQFREYAHNLMKEAHKENYSKELTDKIVSDLLRDHRNEGYGNLIGRLRSGLGNKSYADPTNPALPSKGTDPNVPVTPGGSVNPTPSIQSGTANSKESSVNDSGYSFEYSISNAPELTMESVIGTLVMSIAFAHLYHLCTTNYIYHKSLETYYKSMPDIVDKLAEAYLNKVNSATLKIVIVPNSGNPIDYLTSLKEFIQSYISEKKDRDDFLEFQSYLDDVISCINSSLYPMKRLSEGKKVFSLGTNTYSDELDDLFDKRQVGGVPSKKLKGSLKELIKLIQGQKSAPNFKDIKRNDGRLERQYVQVKSSDWRNMLDIIAAIGEAADITLKSRLK